MTKKKLKKGKIEKALANNSQTFSTTGQNGQNRENYQKSAWNIFLAPKSPFFLVKKDSLGHMPLAEISCPPDPQQGG